MPKIIFDEKETLASGVSEKPINSSGNIYIGRKYAGKKVRWVILKDEESNYPTHEGRRTTQ